LKYQFPVYIRGNKLLILFLSNSVLMKLLERYSKYIPGATILLQFFKNIFVEIPRAPLWERDTPSHISPPFVPSGLIGVPPAVELLDPPLRSMTFTVADHYT
jgi:hypothetical protein